MISLSVLTGCADNFTQPAPQAGTTILQVAAGNDSLKAFVAAITKAGLDKNFANINGGQFTVFAPSNYAFVKYLRAQSGVTIAPVDPNTAGDMAVAAISNITVTSAFSISALVTRLNYHIISTGVTSAMITGAQGFTTLNSARLSLSNVSGATPQYLINANFGSNGANIIQAGDKAVANGVVHVIDKVMTPIANANIWISSLLNFSVNYAVSPITVSITGVSILKDNAGNFDVSAAPVNTPDKDGNYNLFTMALVRANLATVIIPNSTPLPDFTVFAPRNGAFKTYLGVANETLARTAINGMSPDALAAIVNYHIVAGRILSTDFANIPTFTTLSVGNTFSVNATSLLITDAKSLTSLITSKDNLTNAGILHGINAVLQHN